MKLRELYKEYQNEVFKNGHIKENTFSALSFIEWVENKNKVVKPRVEKELWLEISSKYNGFWMKDSTEK